MPIQSFEGLEAWKKAHAVVLETYKFTAKMPAEEKFGLMSQMRRAAISVPANIAEGFKRRTTPDKVHFYNMAQTSLEELRYYFILCRELGYKIDYTSKANETDEVARMLHGLVESLDQRR
jgi:four helix bundle protein